MYCAKCGEEMEGVGGSQMRGCYHFLCTQCIVDAVKAADTSEIPCAGFNGIYRCTGYLEQDEVEFMVPDKVFGRYLERVLNATLRKERGGNDDDGNGQPEKEAFGNLDVSEEEKSCGWAHKVAWIDELVRYERYTFEEAAQHLDMLPILENRSVISCSICFDDVPPGDGLVLKDCLHMFCKDCIGGHIRACEKSAVECPSPDCNEPLKFGEVAALVGADELNRHFEQLSLKEAEASMQNVAHCFTPNCIGFVVVEGITEFQCQVCRARNCITCKMVHQGTCAEYKQRIADDQNRALQQQNDRLSEEAIRQNLTNRVYMSCPRCNKVIEKNGGCPNMVCHPPGGCGHQFVWNGARA